MRYSGTTYLSDGTVSGEEPGTSTHWHVIAVDGVYSAVAGSGIELSGNTISIADESITVEMIASDLVEVINSKEVKTNKKTAFTGNESSDVFYPTLKAVADYAANNYISKTSGSVKSANIDSGAVGENNISYGAVTENKIANSAVSYNKFTTAVKQLINGKEALSNKQDEISTTNVGNHNFYPTLYAVKTYVDAQIARLAAAGGIELE